MNKLTKLTHGEVVTTFKEVPQGKVFTDSDINVYYKIASVQTSDGTPVSAVFVEETQPGKSTLKAGDAVTHLLPDTKVTYYNN